MSDNDENEERSEQATEKVNQERMDSNIILLETLKLQMEQQKQQHEFQMKQQQQLLEQQIRLNQLSLMNNTPQVAPFNIAQKEQWEDWVLMYQRSDFYKSAADDKERIDRLVIAMGVCGQIELRKCCLQTEDASNYKKVIEALTTHFMGTKTVVYWRYLFHTPIQKPDETTEQFVADVRNLVVRCKFRDAADIESELVRDRLVCGIRDQQLRETLLADSKLSLDRVLIKIRAREQSRRENLSMSTVSSSLPKSSGEPHSSLVVENVASVAKRSIERNQKLKTGLNRSNTSPRFNTSTSLSSPSSNSNRCFNCGAANYIASHRLTCPARLARCTNCTNLGHYAKCCRKSRNTNTSLNKVNSVTDDPATIQANEIYDNSIPDESANYFYIDTVYHDQQNSSCTKSDSFIGRIQFNGKIINAKFDSGAEVSVLPPHLVPPGFPISATSRKLCGAGQSPLEVVGSVQIPLANQNKRMIETFYVVRQQRRMLIGAPAITQLGILMMDPWSRVDEIQNLNVEENVIRMYPKLFSEQLGTIPYTYNIELEENATPYSIPIARNVTIPLKEAVNHELNRMIKNGVIEKVNKPTPWCAPMVVARKKNGEVRICTDFSHLNRYVRRPRIVLPDVETSLAEIGRAKIFSKLDAASGFWQIELHKNCRDYTTFMTPMGRYRYRRLPFGITSTPEFFQAAMSHLLNGLIGVTCHMDDVLIYGDNWHQHDERLDAVLKRMAQVGLVLNRKKCVFAKTEVHFLGQVISGEFVRADPERIRAIADFPRPSTVKGVRQLLGSLNQLSKFVPCLATMTEPIRALLRKDAIPRWDHPQQQALEKIVSAIRQTSELIRYDVNALTAVVTDASNAGLGAVLLQTDNQGQWRPVSFSSRTLIPAERNYAPIEKEALAVTWAVEKFRCFLDGKSFEILTDHQPLVSLFGKKDLSQVPLRVQRFKIRLLPFVFVVRHVPGRHLHTADFLSRHPLPYCKSDEESAVQVEAFVHSISTKLSSISALRRQQAREIQKNDPECILLRRMIRDGWPKYRSRVPTPIRDWIPYRNEIVIVEDLLYFRNRLVIPVEMRKVILPLLHEGHLGIVRCSARAKTTVFWPSLSVDLTTFIQNCNTCLIHRNQRRAPLLHHEAQTEAWQRVGADIFFFNNQTYVVIADYFSGYFEVIPVANMAAETVVRVFKEVFARLGIPRTVVSDSGTQFSSGEWREFARSYGFEHIMSSPHHHQSNGTAERAVQTAKRLMEKNEDFQLALLAHRSSPNSSGYSPAELVLGRRIRSRVPFVARYMLAADFRKYCTWRKEQNAKAKENYDIRHRVQEPNDFVPGERVYVRDLKSFATVEKAAETPRSWILNSPSGRLIRRNQQFLVKLALTPTDVSNSSQTVHPEPPLIADKPSPILDLPDDEDPEEVIDVDGEDHTPFCGWPSPAKPSHSTESTKAQGGEFPANAQLSVSPSTNRRPVVTDNTHDNDSIAVRRTRRNVQKPSRYRSPEPSPERKKKQNVKLK